MTSQSPRIYIYKITFEEVPYYYYGVKKEECYNQEYWGSPKTNKWCWELYTPKKQILQVFPYTDEGWLEAQEVEKRLIQPVFNTDKWCLNESCGGKISLKVLRETGKKYGSIGGKIVGKNHYQNKTGFFSITPEQRKEASKKASETNKKNKTGIFGITPKKRSEISKKSGKIGGRKIVELGIGIHGLTHEERKENGSKGGKRATELGVGIHSLTFEERKENGIKNGKNHYKNKTGCFSITTEERKEASKKADETNRKNGTGIYGIPAEKRKETGKRLSEKMNSQKWMCEETGFVSTSGPLTRYQTARGIDTSKRKRIA